MSFCTWIGFYFLTLWKYIYSNFVFISHNLTLITRLLSFNNNHSLKFKLLSHRNEKILAFPFILFSLLIYKMNGLFISHVKWIHLFNKRKKNNIFFRMVYINSKLSYLAVMFVINCCLCLHLISFRLFVLPEDVSFQYDIYSSIFWPYLCRISAIDMTSV